MANLLDTLKAQGLITEEQLQDARAKQVGAKQPLQELLVEMGFLKEEDLLRVASETFQLPIFNLEKENKDPLALKMIPYDLARRHGVFPLRKEGDQLIVAMSNPKDLIALDDIRLVSGLSVVPVLSSRTSITQCIEKYYHLNDAMYDLLKNIVEDDVKVEVQKTEVSSADFLNLTDLKGDLSPIVRLVNIILVDAVKARASDIHIEPQEGAVAVRYRIDGDLKNIMKIPIEMLNALIARFKILAELDITETRKPQDGRSSLSFNNRKIDLRVSVIPTFHGEKIVIRILDLTQARTDLDAIGFEKNELNVFKEAVMRPQGMVLVTGPTGSGKTSTLYAALKFIKSEKRNIVTIEDPIEYLIQGINQIQVNPIKDVTFANGLRSILRQDPNVILVGEIRDQETAEMAFRSALTGHLVLSTVHTNNTVSTVTRLLDLGLEPYLIASSLVLIVAQRLVRKICSSCLEEYTPAPTSLEKYGTQIQTAHIERFYRGKGCLQCDYTGYLGRIAVFEILRVTDQVRSLIDQKAGEMVIYQEARKNGMKLLIESAIEKVRQGLTTLDELDKITHGLEIKKETEPSFGAPAPVAAEPIRSQPCLLVVDDEDDLRKILEKRLMDAGFEVLTAANGQEAVEMATRWHPDLIIMDVMMPVLDGIQSTKMLRSKLETAAIPIIMLTAKRAKEDELEGLEAGADDYITKPYDKDKLLARIKILLKRKAR